MDEKQIIASNADKINQLDKAIKHAYAKADWASHKSATARFHADYPRLFYPGGEERLKALRRADEVAVQTALNFLDVDPQYFRSGYIKEYLWRYIVRCWLTAQDIGRLHQIALRYTERRIQREFWYMCRAMTHIANPEFWIAVRERLNSDDPQVRLRAAYLDAYSRGIEAGERARKQVRYDVLSRKYGAG